MNKTAGSVARPQEPKVKHTDQRKTLSPELREVLNMLKSLEAELGSRQAPSR